MAGLKARPVIGVTGPDRAGTTAWWFTAWAVWRAGGRPRRLQPHNPHARQGPLDGLILGGGADVDPRLYGPGEPSLRPARPGQAQRIGVWWRYGLELALYPLLRALRHLLSLKAQPGPDRRRDAMEFALLARATREGLPVLGICRGAQLLNVFHGGTLHRDLEGFYVETPPARTFLPRKSVRLTPASRLAEILGADPCRVNALHRQAVDAIAGPLRVAAREQTGVVQALERPGEPLTLGVQWHPEYLPQIPRQQALFHALVQAARERISRGPDAPQFGTANGRGSETPRVIG